MLAPHKTLLPLTSEDRWLTVSPPLGGTRSSLKISQLYLTSVLPQQSLTTCISALPPELASRRRLFPAVEVPFDFWAMPFVVWLNKSEGLSPNQGHSPDNLAGFGGA